MCWFTLFTESRCLLDSIVFSFQSRRAGLKSLFSTAESSERSESLWKGKQKNSWTSLKQFVFDSNRSCLKSLWLCRLCVDEPDHHIVVSLDDWFQAKSSAQGSQPGSHESFLFFWNYYLLPLTVQKKSKLHIFMSSACLIRTIKCSVSWEFACTGPSVSWADWF